VGELSEGDEEEEWDSGCPRFGTKCAVSFAGNLSSLCAKAVACDALSNKLLHQSVGWCVSLLDSASVCSIVHQSVR
jgi:hypothetical protein